MNEIHLSPMAMAILANSTHGLFKSLDGVESAMSLRSLAIEILKLPESLQSEPVNFYTIPSDGGK